MHIIALNRHWVIYWRWLAIVLASVALLIGLAIWQWQRAVYKTIFLQKLAQAPEISAQQLTGISLAAADALQLLDEARWLSPVAWLLDNQMRQGHPGYDVIVPVQVNTSREIFLVNLGWTPAPLSRTQLPKLDIPQQFILQGILRTRFGGLRLGGNIEDNGSWPMRIQRIDIAELSAYLPPSLATHGAYQGLVYQRQHSPYINHYQPLVVSPERHRAYALQWGLLALAVVMVALAASVEKNNSAKKESFDAGQ